jgi:hypothetical protein
VGVEKGETILYRIRDLTPVYCQYLGGIAVTALSPDQTWRREYNHSLHIVGTDIKRIAQEQPNLTIPFHTPDEILDRFLHGMFGEAVSLRYKTEKARYDVKRNHTQSTT